MSDNEVDLEKEDSQVDIKIREELKTDKTGYVKVGDIVLLMVKRGKYTGMLSADGVISQSVIVLPRESDKGEGANVLTRSCLFRIENSMKITKSTKKKSEYELKQSLGKALTYGERIQFRHLHSMTFISVETSVMASEAGCLRISMNEESNNKSSFRIKSSNNLRKDGEVVRYTDEVSFVLVSKDSEYFLHVEETSALTPDSKPEVNASGSISSWTVRRFTSYEQYDDNFQYVRTGDSVRIFHKILAGYLCTKEHAEKNSEIYVQKANLTSNSLWELQRTITFVGGTATWNESYRVKHVATGLFLKDSGTGILLTINAYEDGTLFKFTPDQPSTKSSISYGVVLSVQTSKKKYLNVDINSTKPNKQKYKVDLINSTKDFTGVAFIFEDVPEVKTSHIYKLGLVYPYLSSFHSFISEGSVDSDYFEENPERYKFVKGKCEEFKNLLENISKHIIFYPDLDVSLETRQNSIRELGIIDILLSISSLIYRNIVEQSMDYFLDPLDSIYELIYNSIKSNQKNCKSLVAQEKILLSQLQIGIQRGVGRILKEIFKYASQISTINEDNFNQWFSYLKYITKDNIEQQSLYLNILKFLCESQGTGQLRFQSLALKNLINPQAGFSLIKFHIINKRPVIEFDFPKKSCNLRKFLEKNPKLLEIGLVVDEQNLLIDQEPSDAFFYLEDLCEDESYSRYLSCAIEFLSNICLDRYNKALKKIPMIVGITLNHISLVLRNVNINDKIRAAYANLCRVIFIDLDPFYPCSLHKERCYTWENLEKFDDQSLLQRGELLGPIKDIVEYFWSKNSQTKLNNDKPSRSLALVIGFIKLTRVIIDLEFVGEDFIEYIMGPFCFFMMKDETADHWSSLFMKDLKAIMNNSYYPSLENKTWKFQEEILETLHVIVLRRQNIHIQSMLVLFKSTLDKPLDDETLKNHFETILKKLDWNVSLTFNEIEYDILNVEHETEKENVYHMDLYLLQLLFEVCGGKNKNIHKKALSVMIEDVSIRKLLSKELRKCDFLLDKDVYNVYSNILSMSKRLHTTVTLLIQDYSEADDPVKLNQSIKNCEKIIKECISGFKSSPDKLLFQNLLYHSGIYHLFIKILYMNYSKPLESLFKVTIGILHKFTKNHKRNQKLLIKLFNRIIELLSDINLTEFLCRAFSSYRTHPKGLNGLSKVFDLIDLNGCSIDLLRFLRGFVKDSEGNLIASLQIDIMKSIFNSKGIKNILGHEAQDIFSPLNFLDETSNYEKFVLHIELIKNIIACSINNPFGILQGRKLISILSLKQVMARPSMTIGVKNVYFRYLQLMHFSSIEGEIEPDLNINSIGELLKDFILPEIKIFKDTVPDLLDLARKGGFNTILKNSNKIKYNPNKQELALIEYWNSLTHNSNWCDEEGGILNTLADIFNQNSMKLDEGMESVVSELKNILYEINDYLTSVETINNDIILSKFISAANFCRESLPRTTVFTIKGPESTEKAVVIELMQKYIIDNKLSLDEAFADFDVNEDGNIEFEEFRTTMKKILGDISSAEIEIAFNDMDEDHNGSIKFSEFANKIRKYFSKVPRVVKIKKNGSHEIPDQADPIRNTEIELDMSLKESLNKFTDKFLFLTEGQDIQVLVDKIKQKYIEPALKSKDASLSESIKKLGLVFEKKRHKIYLIKILKLLVRNFESKETIFDEGDLKEYQSKKEFMEFQVILSDAGVLYLALSLIQNNSDVRLVEESVQLLLSLLKFGNQSIQEKLLKLLKGQNDSNLFSYIRNQLRDSRDIIVKKGHKVIMKDHETAIENILLRSSSKIKLEPEDEIQNSAPYIVKSLIELIQLCCDNCYLPFQDYIRTQQKPGSLIKQVSINLIDEICEFLISIKHICGILLKDLQGTNVVIQCFETMVDACRGPCLENQVMLGTKKKLMKFLNSIFELYDHNEDYINVFKSAVKFLAGLLEGCASEKIIKTIIDYIDFELLAKLALRLYNDYLLPNKSAVLEAAIVGVNDNSQLLYFIKTMCKGMKLPLKELNKSQWEIICTGFQITIITLKLREKYRNVGELQWLCFSDEQPDYTGKPMLEYIIKNINVLGGYTETVFKDIRNVFSGVLNSSSRKLDMNEAYEFYSSLISTVEIDKDKHIEKCYFQVPACMIFLNESMRQRVIYGINRDSDEEKIKSFLFMTEKIQLELEHLQILSKIYFIGWMVSRYNFFALLLFFCIVCANLIIVFTVSSIADHNYNAGAFPGTNLMTALGCMIIFLSIVMYILSILSSYPTIIFDKINNNYDSDIYKSEESEHINGTVRMISYIEETKKESSSKDDRYSKYFLSVLFNFENLINIGLVVLACLGWYSPFFYAFMMLDIIRRSDTLKSVLLVITKNKKSLGLTLVLLIIIGYIYGVWGFKYLGQYYQLSEGNYAFNTYCHTLWDCVISTLGYGISAGAGIAGVIYPTFEGEEYHSLRMFFDITFFIIIPIILLNIIFGIIVDTFAELRDERQDVEQDIQNVCIICCRQKHEFELRGSGWNNHIQLEHNVWAYIAYVIYIKKKLMTDCDGIEKYVKSKLIQNDVSFFPTSALCLEKDNENQVDTKELITKDLDEVQKKLKTLQSSKKSVKP